MSKGHVLTRRHNHGHADMKADPLIHEDTLRSKLELDRAWAVYVLCDLEAPLRQHSRYLTPDDPGDSGVVLVYSAERFTSVIPCGDSESVRRILANARDLPRVAFFQARTQDLAALELRFTLTNVLSMGRMILSAADLIRPRKAPGRIVRLSLADSAAVESLYALWQQSIFSPGMLEHGVYFGAIVDGILVSIAGTHAISRSAGIGVIGNVFTHPQYRNRGLAGAVTGSVARALVEDGIRDLALNVVAGNVPAVRAYERLGFRMHQPFHEGLLTARR